MIPERLKLLRENKNLSKAELAKLLDMPYTTYVNYETGSREPGSKILIKISKFYNVSIDYLMGVSDVVKPITNNTEDLKNSNNSEKKEIPIRIIAAANGNAVNSEERGKEILKLKMEASRLIYSGEFDIRQLNELIGIISVLEKTRW